MEQIILSSLFLDDQVVKQSTLDHILFLFNQFPIKYHHLHKLAVDCML